MVQDKERLYEEAQQYKLVINQLKADNGKLKTKCSALEDELLKIARQ